jgi:hypothetical protein
MSREIIFLNDFKDLKIENCIVYFYINDNFFHKKIKSIFIEVKNVNIYFINIEKFREYIKIYNLRSVPTILFFKNKREKLRLQNIVSRNEIIKHISDIYS